ncbi:MAG: RluA family pseudouridine synthase [Planctomycetes bacterium]|nr:RluA family pseudouridine synthase [Planctomycetota bacterium]
MEFNPDLGEFVETTVAKQGAGSRLDAYLAATFKKQSRSYIRKLIDGQMVEVDGVPTKASKKLRGGETLSLFIPDPVELEARPEQIDLDILFEDRDLIVLNKAPGIVVHPSPGHETGSLVNGLLYHCKDLSGIGGILRPGIVHRLDRDTSGVMVAAKNDLAHQGLAKQFAERITEKTYCALTHGCPSPESGRIEAPIGRNPRHHVLMAVIHQGEAKEAITDYRLLDSFGPYSYLVCRLHTGRTHQIRVHLAYIGCPILCDDYYGRESSLTRAELAGHGVGQASGEGSQTVLSRQALHAKRLAFKHPRTGERLEFEAPLLEDFQNALGILRSRNDLK